MASSLRTRLSIDITGQPTQFAYPFVQTFLSLARDPSVYQVSLAAAGTAVVWDGVPLGSTFDFVALISDRDCQVEFVVYGGEADEYRFTVPLRGGGFPIVIPGGQSYAGQAGTESSFTFGTLRNITKINALNEDADNAAVISVCIAEAA